MKNKDKKEVIMALDPVIIEEARKAEEEDNIAKSEGREPRDSMLGAILKSLQSHERTQMQRMAFETDPINVSASWGSIYRLKSNLTPDHVIKRIIGPQGDDLVCQILQARSNHISSFGRPRSSRFAIGFEFEEMKEVDIDENDKEFEQRKEKLSHLKEVMWNCGYKGIDDAYFHPNLSQFLKMITRDGLGYGRFAVEFIWAIDAKTGQKKCHAFRSVDAGTIYRVVPNREKDQSTRIDALRMLAELKNEKFDKDKYLKDEYKWIQVVDNRPVQAFTDDELCVYNLYPVTNVEYNGYPLTPIDQALNAITTHINITIHNKLYFQHGRAARGMLVFNSDDIDEGTVQKIRMQFHQSINSVQNSWRMPVFAVGKEDQLSWQSIDVSGRDAEFQYLSDSNARVILSAFQMSPEELPGYAHLARGTNTQALSESDNEWKLIAARDVGLKPLLYDIQDFLNTHVFPKFDQELSKEYQMVLAGLDKDSPEKEATRLAQDMPIHMTYNDVLKQVEKTKIPRELGGDMPMNPQFGQMLDKYLTVGEIMENFLGRKGAAADPRYNFYNNPIWLQWQQIVMQKAQMGMQMQMQQQQAEQQAQMQQQGGEAPPGEEQAPPGASPEEQQQVAQKNEENAQEWLNNNYTVLQKATAGNANHLTKMILARHKEIVNNTMKQWQKDSLVAIEKIMAEAKGMDKK